MAVKLTDFFNHNFQKRKQTKQIETTYTDAVETAKNFQIERKYIIDELTSISNLMKSNETTGEINVTTK